jgi:hypothetical protein
MADKVEIGGRSKYEVAHRIALALLSIDGKKGPNLTRKEYLTAIADAMDALSGIRQ